MSTEETKEEREREEKIPLYFDRYVASELHALGQRITDLKGIMEERFAQVYRRFDESREYVDMRFEEVNQRFDKLDSTLKGAFGLLAGLFVPVIVGILAIIIKMFFSGKISH